MSSPATMSENPNAIFRSLFASRAISINHIGYERFEAKRAIACLADGPEIVSCRLIDAATGAVLLTACLLGKAGPVANWQGQSYQSIDFSDCTSVCTAKLEAMDSAGEVLASAPFVIGDKVLVGELPTVILSYFQNQRCDWIYAEADRSIPFVGSKVNEKADVHGGWYDASGDVSKYLSHLSYANYMNPQQTPMVVWALLRSAESNSVDDILRSGLQTEALWGADFLVRMCRPDGTFCMIVFDKWSGDPMQREICSYSTQKGYKHDTWEAGMRQGGGMAIAALARASRLQKNGSYTTRDYLAVAERGYANLKAHGLSYLDDGKENIIDDYCGLIAAIELSQASPKELYRADAAARAEQLLKRMSSGHGRDGWWRSGDDDNRPFTHAAEEGLPLLALALYVPLASPELGEKIRRTLGRAVAHLLSVTTEVPNPFSYPRHFVRQPDGSVGTQFFYSHVNESGYWWQGENARLASLACAIRAIEPLVDLPAEARALPSRYLSWILGANPFHSSMVQGFGRNASTYSIAKIGHPRGGICNGITAGLNDETAIAFCETEDVMHSWRWSELWIPHAAWFLLALTEYGNNGASQ
jgi:hypothetical protein